MREPIAALYIAPGPFPPCFHPQQYA
jgi:hypothetical protein